MKLHSILAVLLAAVSQPIFARPELSGFAVGQDVNTRLVTIDYTLSESAIVTLDIQTNGVSIGAENFRSIREPLAADNDYPAGRVVSAGAHRLFWQPMQDWVGQMIVNGGLKVVLKAWAFDAPPDYMVIDMTTKSNRWYYASLAELPDGGIKTADPSDSVAVAALANDAYRTTRLVMRRIPARDVTWRMGSPSGETGRSSNETAHYVTLTNDYFISIYPMTGTQYNYANGSSPGASTVPAYYVTYDTLRGSATGTSFCWPTNGHAVLSTSMFGKLRTLTGLEFDMPTEAQWEYACRAGTSGRWCNNHASSAESVAWTLSHVSTKDRHCVGLKDPNAWGIYDMHGNVQEWVLDQYAAYTTDEMTDPVGPCDNAANRIVRGGSSWQGDTAARSAARRTLKSSANSDSGYGGGPGVRLCCPVTVPSQN